MRLLDRWRHNGRQEENQPCMSITQRTGTRSKREWCLASFHFYSGGTDVKHFLHTNAAYGKLDLYIQDEDKAMAYSIDQYWQPLDDGRMTVRFCTSWATTDEAVDALTNAVKSLT